MATVFVLRIPGWRAFVIHVPELGHMVQSGVSLLCRKVRPRIFAEIQAGNDDVAIQLATPSRLARWRGELGESPLVAAINNGRSELACRLLEIGGTAPNDGALAAASMVGDLHVVYALLAAGKNPDELGHADSKGMTPLMWATNRKHIKVIEALLEAGADVDAVAKDGSTAIMFTREGKPQDLEALEVLCRYKPNIGIKDWRGRDFLREAMDRERCGGKPEIRRLLERYYPEVKFDAAI